MMPISPVDVRELFPGERAALLALLESLAAAEWGAATACAGWSVQDVAAHLLGDDLGRLARGRDGHASPNFQIDPGADAYRAVVDAIDRQNAAWVETMRRLSPRLLGDLLRLTGEQTAAYFATLDPLAPGPSVDWVSPAPAPVWLDLAREYTERWHHQQHIRDAVGRPGLREREWMHPALATFALGLPRALAASPRPDGTRVRFAVTGAAADSWEIAASDQGWSMVEASDEAPAATVMMSQDAAWRLFTRGLSPAAAREHAVVTGDPDLVERVLRVVSILA